MKTVIINGQNHKGSTYTIAHILADKIGGETREFFLPKDFGNFCVGCGNCILKDEKLCPHYEKLLPITEAMDEADIIILASPVYVYHCTGSMKAFLDHYGYRWMVHRPQEKMFKKKAVCITTAAGAGTKSTIKDMKDSLFFWGVPKVYSIGMAVQAMSYDRIAPKRKAQIEKKTSALADKLKSNKNPRVGLKTKGFFLLMRMLQKDGWNDADKEYWAVRGWNKGNRPWK